MKILSITAQKPHSTGSGTYLTELVRSWNEAGHTQAVVCGIFPEDNFCFPDSVKCYPVYFSHRITSQTHMSESSQPAGFSDCEPVAGSGAALPFPVVGMSDIMPYESTLYRDLTLEMVRQFDSAFISTISRAIDELDPDLIVCHHLFLLTALVRKHFPDRRVAGISHGTDLRQMINCDNLRDLVRPEIASLDHIFALHGDQKDRIMEIFGAPSDKVIVIGSGYNDKLFNAVNRAPRKTLQEISEGMQVPVIISYAGKMSRPKGVPELLTALRVLEEDPDVPYFEVSLAGGCQDDAVRQMLDNLPDRIHWHGQIPQEMLADVLRYSDIFVLPSYFEGLPLVLMEAMASGAVPVSTDLPGVRDWAINAVPGNNIRFVPMPEMKSIDQPTEKGRGQFVRDLTEALRSLIIDIAGDQSDALLIPDTSGITWDGVASRILHAVG